MTKEEIKDLTSMPEVLSRYGIRVSRGMCSCPFHGTDRHPSMQVFKDGFKCHTCGEYGDIFGFVMKYEGVDFKEAFKILGGTYKVLPKKERIRQKSAYERAKEERVRAEESEKKFKRQLGRTLSGLRIAVKICEPMGDLWSYAQQNLPYIEYVWEEKYVKGSEVNELDVYRKCREIDKRLGIG